MIRLAERAGREPFFLAYHLAQLRREYGQTFAEQAAAFGLEPEGLAWLALCRMPATAEDLERIASHMAMEPAALGELLRSSGSTTAGRVVPGYRKGRDPEERGRSRPP
jgi:hypothetical protein